MDEQPAQRMRSALLTLQSPVGAMVALTGGALTPLAFAPFNLWLFSILGPALLLACLADTSERQAAWRGWLFGVGFYGTGVSWVYVSIHEFGYAPAWLAAALTLLFVLSLALMPALLSWAWRRWFEHKPGAILLGFPGAWILIEWLRYWLLSGFPWNYLGYAHVDTPLAGWAPIGGVYALSWICVLSAGAGVILLQHRFNAAARIAAILMIAIAWGGGWLLRDQQWTQPRDMRPLSVALVQGNVAQDLKWQPGQLAPTLRIYEDATRAQLGQDLVVWPEAAIPTFMHQVQPWLDQIDTIARQTETGIITGIPFRRTDTPAQDNPVYHNSITALGTANGLYHKRKLVPFGEYVPFEAALRGVIRFLDLPMSNFQPGGEPQQGLTMQSRAGTVRFAPYICYEIVYPDFVARTYADADILITISNDAWFGGSSGPAQHLQIAQMRAMELGREIIRATNDGYTALIDHRGAIRSVAPRFERVTLTGEVQAYTGRTPFSRWGSGGALVLGLLLALLTRRVHRPQPPA